MLNHPELSFLNRSNVPLPTTYLYDGTNWRLFWNTIRAVGPEAEGIGISSGPWPMTSEGELRTLWATALPMSPRRLTIMMDYAGFDDFCLPKIYGQGRLAAFFEALLEVRRERLREALRGGLSGWQRDGPRGFESAAWAVGAVLFDGGIQISRLTRS